MAMVKFNKSIAIICNQYIKVKEIIILIAKKMCPSFFNDRVYEYLLLHVSLLTS